MRNQRPKPGSRLALARESRESRGMGELGNVSLSGTKYHPMFSQDLKYSAQVVGDAPDDQVNATISLMRQYALEDSTCPEIQVEAEALRAMNGGDPYRLVSAVWQTVSGKVQFLRDEVLGSPLEAFMSRTNADGTPVTPIVEILIRPRDMHNMAAARLGDCDDFSMYAASLLTALDIPCNFVTVAGDESNPNIFTHVYVAAYPNGERVVVDASHGPECGWEVYRPSGRKQEWAVSGNAPNAGMSVGWLVAAGVAVLGFVLCGGKL